MEFSYTYQSLALLFPFLHFVGNFLLSIAQSAGAVEYTNSAEE